MGKRYFSLDDANALVPQLADIMRRLLQLHSHLRVAVESLRARGIEVSSAMLSGDEEVECEPEALRMYAHARGFYEAIREGAASINELGAEIKDVASGLVDFRSLLDGDTEVLLCWRVGEKAITHFHLPEAGYAGRQPVADRDFLDERRTVH